MKCNDCGTSEQPLTGTEKYAMCDACIKKSDDAWYTKVEPVECKSFNRKTGEFEKDLIYPPNLKTMFPSTVGGTGKLSKAVVIRARKVPEKIKEEYFKAVTTG